MTGGDAINVLINVEDVDDNGPRFGGSTDGQTGDIVAGESANLLIYLSSL